MSSPVTPNTARRTHKPGYIFATVAFALALGLSATYIIQPEEAFKPERIMSLGVVAGVVFYLGTKPQWSFWKKLGLCTAVGVIGGLLGALLFA